MSRTWQTMQRLGDALLSQFGCSFTDIAGDDSKVDTSDDALLETGDEFCKESLDTVSFSIFVILDCRGFKTGFGFTVFSVPKEITNPEKIGCVSVTA